MACAEGVSRFKLWIMLPTKYALYPYPTLYILCLSVSVGCVNSRVGWSEVEHGEFRRVGFVLGDIFAQFEKSLFEGLCLFLHSEVKVLAVDVIQAFYLLSKFLRKFLSERLRGQMVNHPHRMFLILGDHRQALVLKGNVFELALRRVIRNLISFVVQFGLLGLLGNFNPHDGAYWLESVLDI